MWLISIIVVGIVFPICVSLYFLKLKWSAVIVALLAVSILLMVRRSEKRVKAQNARYEAWLEKMRRPILRVECPRCRKPTSLADVLCDNCGSRSIRSTVFFDENGKKRHVSIDCQRCATLVSFIKCPKCGTQLDGLFRR